MKLRNSIILCINSRERTTKKFLSDKFVMKSDSIQDTIKWFNAKFDNKILYDKNGYFMQNALSDIEMDVLDSVNTQKNNIEIIYQLVTKSLLKTKKIPQVIDFEDNVYYKSTLNNFLEQIKLPNMGYLIECETDKKIYYLSILPLCFTESDENNVDYYTDQLLSTFNICKKSERDCINNIINEDIHKIIATCEADTFSYHTFNCLRIAFLAYYLINEGKYISYETQKLFEYNIPIPSYVNKQTFNTLFIFESNLNIFEDENLNIKEEIHNYYGIEYLDLQFGAISPELDSLPLKHPYITHLFYNIKKKHSSFIHFRILCCVVFKYLMSNEFKIPINIINNEFYDYDSLIYKTAFYGKELYIKKDDKSEVYLSNEKWLIKYKSLLEFKNISDMLVLRKTYVLSLEEYTIYLVNSIPKIYFSNILLIFKKNFPNANIIMLDTLSSESHKNKTYSIITNSKFKSLELSNDSNNFSPQFFL